jgi:hypothetical protein
MAKFVIMNDQDNYWSDTGWVLDPKEANIYTFKDTETLELPTGGKWCRLT